MFLLIAIAAFFILGIAFIAFDTDDFGITRLKEDQSNTSIKKNRNINFKSISRKIVYL